MLKFLNENYKVPTKHWEVFDYFIYPDGTKELVSQISHNLVVENLSVAIACLMKRQAGYSGILYWGIGSGLTSWAEDNPPSPKDTDQKLENEFFRKAINISDMVFINADNTVSEVPTNRIQASIVFDETEANGKMMEFAIFAGNATTAVNSGFMINHKTHPAIHKTNLVKLEKTIRFTF